MPIWQPARLLHGLAASAAALLLASPAALIAREGTSEPVPERIGFTVLGTNSGAIPSPHRMQPANVLVAQDRAILVDAGDGAATQLAKAGISLRQVDAVLLSHLHFDHIGGLFALISQRFQIQEKTPLSVSGPSGTRQLVAALCEAIGEAARNTDLVSYGTPACTGVTAFDLTAGEVLSIHGVEVTVAANSHYATSGSQTVAQSLSFRFRTLAGTLAYTGDTGPSVAVEKLARGTDVLVSEIVDPELELAEIRRGSPGLPASLLERIDEHLRQNHLSPAEVGKLASESGAKRLVLTHVSFDSTDITAVLAEIAKYYSGPVVVAEDLGAF